ncbi:MAG: phosphoribosylanthranilate isomerase [Alphaproteobacteria bacterium]
MPIQVKICGISDEVAMKAAVRNGASFVGLVFFPPSPRCVTPERAAELVDGLPENVTKVGLFVDADDVALETVLNHVRLDLLQFHGQESPQRVEAVRREFAIPILKMIPVAVAADLEQAKAYEDVADWLLFDAKARPDAALPGGNARAFDWSLLRDRTWALPWMLAGGLTVDNLAAAVRTTGAAAVDVSSGVEDRPGVKNPDKIRAFLEMAAKL